MSAISSACPTTRWSRSAGRWLSERFGRPAQRHCEERERRSNPFFLTAARWIASHSRYDEFLGLAAARGAGAGGAFEIGNRRALGLWRHRRGIGPHIARSMSLAGRHGAKGTWRRAGFCRRYGQARLRGIGRRGRVDRCAAEDGHWLRRAADFVLRCLGPAQCALGETGIGDCQAKRTKKKYGCHCSDRHGGQAFECPTEATRESFNPIFGVRAGLFKAWRRGILTSQIRGFSDLAM